MFRKHCSNDAAPAPVTNWPRQSFSSDSKCKNKFLSAHACGESIGRMPLAALRFPGRSSGQFIKHCFYDFEVLASLRTTQIH
ncbi:hypothetical protein M5D96_001200 [Drosophila gunungcola]|uniref:Uncharacterized protein n=1 Tax=Drosophila gunungcola TaxID=103775 RepID=A0A9P9YYC9_9MUSC|nr:hypothetical protein M5D96_001200 [Drosophila gunungcola]